MLYYTTLYYNILYHTVLYYTVLYCTVLYCTVLYYTILYYTILYYTILYYTILYYTVVYYTILYCAVLCCAVLCCAVLCCAVLCCAILYIYKHVKKLPLLLWIQHFHIYITQSTSLKYNRALTILAVVKSGCVIASRKELLYPADILRFEVFHCNVQRMSFKWIHLALSPMLLVGTSTASFTSPRHGAAISSTVLSTECKHIAAVTRALLYPTFGYLSVLCIFMLLEHLTSLWASNIKYLCKIYYLIFMHMYTQYTYELICI